MVQLMDVGPVADQFAAATASQSFSPLNDRGAIVKGIFIDKPSAADTWYVAVAGRYIGAFRVDTAGNQNLLSGPASAAPKNENIFNYVKSTYGRDLIYPVGQGQTITVSSLGGATADVHILYSEYSPNDITPGLLNHPSGRHFLTAVALAPPNNVTHASGVAEDNFAAQYGLPWLPTLYGNVQIPAAWEIDVLDMFAEGGGRNTYNGSADHQSVTDHIALIYKGTRYFTRAASGGLTNIGQASAAGSANTVFGADAAVMPAFQLQADYSNANLPHPLRFRGGDTVNFLFGTSGDSTGGADYSKFYLVLLLDVRIGG